MDQFVLDGGGASFTPADEAYTTEQLIAGKRVLIVTTAAGTVVLAGTRHVPSDIDYVITDSGALTVRSPSGDVLREFPAWSFVETRTREANPLG